MSHRNRPELTASFLSGFAALIYQVVWQRVLAQEVGIDLLSTKFTVIIFLVGLAAGYQTGKKLAHGSKLGFARLFMLCEFFIGAFGLVSVTLLRSVRSLEFASRWIPNGHADLIVVAAIILIPTFFMGLSGPMLIGLVRHISRQSGDVIGRLYGANVLGASVGTFASGLVLIELWGCQTTVFVAALANFTASALAFPFRNSHTTTTSVSSYSPTASAYFRYALAAVLLGFSSLTFEMVAFRTVSFFFGLAAYQFPFVLGVFLLAMAFGEWLGGKLSNRSLKFGPIQVLILALSVSLCLAYLVTRWGPEDTITHAIKFREVAKLIIFSLVFMAPIIFISAFFPLMMDHLGRTKKELVACSSALLFWMTVANIVGALFTTFYLLPRFGSATTLLIVGLMVFVASVVIDHSKRTLAFTAAGLLAVLLFHHDFFRTHQKNQIELVEDSFGVLSVDSTNGPELSIRLSRTPTASAYPRDDNEFHSQIGRWTMGITHFKSHPIKQALVIGLGNGMVTYGLTLLPEIEQVTVIELLPSVTDLVLKHSNPLVRKVLEGPKVKIVHNDGRRFLQHLEDQQKFDLIQIAVFHPWTSGASNVYSAEFFHTLKNHLTPGGLVATLNYYPLVDSTALSVFPYGYSVQGWNNRFHYFSNEAIPIPEVSSSVQHETPYCPEPAQTPRIPVVLNRIYAGQSEYISTDDLPLLEHFFFRQTLARFTGVLLRHDLGKPSRTEKLAELSVRCSQPGKFVN